MKILIVTYHYAPEITPRAFRASSIFKSLTELGHDVEVVTPSSGCKEPKSAAASPSRIKTLARKFLEKTLPGGIDLKNIPFFINQLKAREVDLLISVGLPFSVHLSVALAKRFYGLSAKVTMFDYGDPYSGNPNGNCCFYARHIEKWVLRYTDYVMTPVAEAVPLFSEIVSDNCRVEVIPQGYEINDITISEYSGNSVPTFCYAGILYKGIREPLSFLEYVSELEIDYRFIVYTNVNSSENLSILTKYSEKMSDRLIVKPMISREDCLKELSKMDFLVNFNNEGGVQQPSKLVDYTLSSRPYLSISNDQDNFSLFDSYLNSEYGDFRPIDISKFDRKLVANKILILASEVSYNVDT